MANPASNTAVFDAMLRDVYPFDSQYFKQFNESTPLLTEIESGDVPVKWLAEYDGRRMYIPVTTGTGGNQAVGTGESGSRPTSGVIDTNKLVYNIATHTSASAITGLQMDNNAGGKQSVVKALKLEMDGLKSGGKRKMGWLLHGDGSGMVAALASAGNSGSTLRFVANADIGILKADSNGLKGSEVIIRDMTAGTKDSGQTANLALRVLTLTGSTGATPQITVQHENGASYTASGTDLSSSGVYWYDSQGSSMLGLGIFCTDQNPATWGSSTAFLGGVNRAVETWWQGYAVSAASATVDLIAHIRPILNKINERAGDELGDGDMLYAPVRYDNWEAIGLQMSRNQITTNKPVKLTGGWDAVQYQNVVFIKDRDAPATKIRFFNPKKKYRYRSVDWKFDDRSGSIFKQQSNVDGRDNDNWKFYLYTRQQMLSISSLCDAELNTISASL